MKRDIAGLAYELCSIPSVSAQENQLMGFVEQKLFELGFAVEKIPVAGLGDRFNIFAYFGQRKKFLSILCTHLDTVAPFIAPKLEAGILWGRGSCDAKGIASAMIFACLEQHALGFDDVALLFSVGEETSSDGAKACNDVLAGLSHYLIVGEPTDNVCAFAQKGSLVFDLVAHGVQAHSSMPHLGDSAIHRLVKAVAKIIEHPWGTHELYGETLVNIGEIQGGHVRNMVADHAKALGIIRAGVDPKGLLDSLKNLAGEKIDVDVLSLCAPFLYFVPENFPSFCAGFGSDAPYLNKLGLPLLVGPGQLELAHKDNEHVYLKDLDDGCDNYQKIITKLRELVCHE